MAKTKMGRPTNNPRTERLQMRFSRNEVAMLRECAEKMHVPKTSVIVRGLELVLTEIAEKQPVE